MPVGSLYKTGQISRAHARYGWMEYTDGSKTPKPTEEEMYIDLDNGEVFPPIRSANKGAIWIMMKYL